MKKIIQFETSAVLHMRPILRACSTCACSLLPDCNRLWINY